MSQAQAIFYVILPLLSAVAYFVGVSWESPAFANVVLSEQGIIENATAVFLLIAAILGFTVVSRTRGAIPRAHALLILLFGIGALWASLEEVSYGQQFFHWTSPDWFRANNVNRETNLHNLFGNVPMRRIRLFGYLFSAIAWIALPIAVRRIPRLRGRFADVFVPGYQLVVLAILSQIVNLPNKLPELVPSPWRSPHLRELQELYWAWAVFGYVRIVRARLLPQEAASRIPVARSAEAVEVWQPRRTASTSRSRPL